MGQAVELAVIGHPPGKGVQVLKKAAGPLRLQALTHKPFNGPVISLIRVDPTGVDFGLIRRLLHIGQDSLPELGQRRAVRRHQPGFVVFFLALVGGKRPGSYHGLVKEVFIVTVGRKLAIDLCFADPVQPAPPG